MYTYSRKSQIGIMPDEINQVTLESTIKSFDYSGIHRSKIYTETMNTYFDITDSMTRNVLLSVNEADQNSVMTSLANKLYEHIVEKVDDIDFGTIPQSKGDITKIDNYDQLMDCINIITEILQSYNQDTRPVEIVTIAVQNMIDRREMFEKAYKFNIEMPIIIYNTIALSIVSAVSFMISSCIEFIKISDTEGFDIVVNKNATIKTKDNILYTDLEKFNKLCASGEFDKAMDYVINTNIKNFSGISYGLGGVAAVLGIILIIIPLIRELIFFFYYSRAKVSNYFDAQSALLTVNAYNIENNLTRDVKNKKQVVAKQKKIADKFKKIADAIAIENKTGSAKASKEIADVNNTKYKTDEVLDKMPDSANSVLF